MSAISKLYYGTKVEKFASAYLDEQEDLILSLLNEDISDALTKVFLGNRDSELLPLLEELGLCRIGTVTERGMRIIKAYPLFGNGERTPYPYHMEFFPFLFSSILNGHVSARSDRFLQTGTFSSMFPSHDAETIKEVGAKTISALKDLGVINRKGSWYTLDIEKALSFMALDEVSRLTYILYPEADAVKRRSIGKAFRLLLLTNGLPLERWEELQTIIQGATGITLDKDLLLLYGLLQEENGELTAVDLYGTATLHGVISSDMELSYHGRVPYELWRMAEPVSEDTLTRWVINKSSIKSALDTGLQEEEIISILNRFSDGYLSDTIIQRISSWVSQYNTAKATRAILLETDDRTGRILEGLPQFQQYIISHPAERFFIMDSYGEEEWRKELETLGYDMLGRTTGPEFVEEEAEMHFSRVPTDLDFPTTREVPYNERRYEELYSSAKSLLMRKAIENHLVFQQGMKLKLAFADGLDYQAKISVIEGAIADKDKLYLLDAELKESIVEPLSINREMEEQWTIRTPDGEIEIGPIWKVAQISKLFK